MKIIPVKVRNKLASLPMLVDDWDYEILKTRKWRLDHQGYPTVSWKSRSIGAHKIIMWCPKGLETDHIDGNPLNNQKENLRVCSHIENMRNRKKQKNNRSGYKGVCRYMSNKKWVASIKVDNKKKHLGYFNNAKEAFEAYKQAAKKYHGDFASW